MTNKKTPTVKMNTTWTDQSAIAKSQDDSNFIVTAFHQELAAKIATEQAETILLEMLEEKKQSELLEKGIQAHLNQKFYSKGFKNCKRKLQEVDILKGATVKSHTV